MRCAGYENVELHLGDLNNGYPIINCNHRWRFTITPDFSDRRHSNSDRAAPAQLYRGNLPHYYWPGRRVSPVTALFASNPLWGILVGSGTGMIAMVLGATVAERWFVRNRGLVLGILTASNTTGQLIFLPLLGGKFRMARGFTDCRTDHVADRSNRRLRFEKSPCGFFVRIALYFGSVPGGVHPIGIKANSACRVYA